MNAKTLLIAAFLLLLVSPLSATQVTKVEETWELVVTDPSVIRNAPQVTMVMSPLAHTQSDFFIFTLNHKAEPVYVAGGMQVCRYHGESLAAHQNGPKNGAIHVPMETISWTQTMALDAGTITFEVSDGNSGSWGEFGGQGYLKSSVAAPPGGLDGYQPKISTGESEIGFAGNRVTSLTLKTVKWTLSDGSTFTLTAPFDINAHYDPTAD